MYNSYHMKHKRRKRQVWPLRPLVIIAVVAAIIGIGLLRLSHADTFSIGAEAEEGTPAGNTGPGETADVSGSGSIKFGGTGGGGGGSSVIYDAACSKSITASTAGKLSGSSVVEASSLSESHTTDDVYWTQNDHGDSARIFSLNGVGKVLGTFPISGASATDWEETDVGPGPESGRSYIYIADTGDNSEDRGSYAIYRTPEPDPNSGKSLSAEKFSFKYPDGKSHNTEAMFVDQQTGEVYLIDKSDSRKGQIYKSQGMLGGSTTFTKIGDIGFGSYELITGADMAIDNKTIAIVTYEGLYLFKKSEGMSVLDALKGTPCKVPGYSESHGEAVAFRRDGGALYTVSDASGSSGAPLHLFVPRPQ